jgi:quercetin dioxygenase-like cupin family protein
MANFKVLVVALALAASMGCKKKPKEGSGGTATPTADAAAMAATPDAAEAPPPPPAPVMVNMVPADLKWGPMDPAMGDKGPQVAGLWGDRTTGPNGFLIKVTGGNKGVFHTHSTGYHGVTIAGEPNHLQANETKPKPLPPGSYWFVPGGAPHNSQCLGKEDCIALVQFNEGKADFAMAEPKKEDKPDPKYVEKRAKDLKWTPLDPKAGAKGPQTAVVWGDSASGEHGFLMKLPAGFKSPPHTHSADYHALPITGAVMNYAPDDKAPKEMPVGSYWMQPGNMAHITECKAGKECLIYGYMKGKFDFAPAGDAAGDAGSGSAAGGSAGSAEPAMKDEPKKM